MAERRPPDEAHIKALEAQRERIQSSRQRRVEQQLDPFDCALSEWADEIGERKLSLEIQVERQGGVSTFPALYYLDGRRAPAKLLETRFGIRWALLDETGRLTGRFLPVAPTRESTLAKRGFREGQEEAPAKATVVGKGRGLSGQARAAIVRTDGGCPPEALTNQPPPAPEPGVSVFVRPLEDDPEPDRTLVDPSACGCGDGFCGGCDRNADITPGLDAGSIAAPAIPPSPER